MSDFYFSSNIKRSSENQTGKQIGFSDDLLRYAQSGVILARQFVYGID